MWARMLNRKAGNSMQSSTIRSRSGSALDAVQNSRKNQWAFDAKNRKPGPVCPIDDNKDSITASRKALPCPSDCYNNDMLSSSTCPIPALLNHYFECWFFFFKSHEVSPMWLVLPLKAKALHTTLSALKKSRNLI